MKPDFGLLAWSNIVLMVGPFTLALFSLSFFFLIFGEVLLGHVGCTNLLATCGGALGYAKQIAYCGKHYARMYSRKAVLYSKRAAARKLANVACR